MNQWCSSCSKFVLSTEIHFHQFSIFETLHRYTSLLLRSIRATLWCILSEVSSLKLWQHCLTIMAPGALPVVWSRPVFLKLGSSKGCQGFRETKMRNGGRVLLAIQNLCTSVNKRSILIVVFLKVILNYFQEAWCLPFWFFNLTIILMFWYVVKMNRKLTIHSKGTLFYFTFDLLWRGGSSSVTSVAF